ncbi:RNA-binding cell elongation regulator Jag/EloR [Salidesulfovibrio onnuriiensis]|uniref:RNA-binding cell elongation regulator Jag/EloR n=1 Tax=Salidesulfovibrio onnuriiensis TaxID=2583823 RepID=UPI0011CA3367|nr:RNA-binding cell elongation regulator Jag/EloR [Salidesulfovibrio onnuriiensis]
MSDFKEFQGKTLDEAIETACDFYNLQRNKLEIEIIKGGSTGIFGLVGVKKAVVKARPRGAVDTEEILNGKNEEKKDKAPRKEAAKSERPKQERKRPERKKPEPKVEEKKVAPEVSMGEIPSGPVSNPDAEAKARFEAVEMPEEQPSLPLVDELADLDKEKLEAVVREVTNKLLVPIVGEDPKLEITFDPDRVKVFIDDEENSGLIIGREGQTLSSLQYLVNRLVSRAMEASVRIQIDTGEYRERQDEKLRQIALHLAEKAKRIGRTQSTKPLSSYHRRVVHLALQENETVFTRSKGEGPMKRVLIVPKRKNGNNRRQRQ